ncbi:MAG: NnrS family protein [Acidobacteria bacterium]|nr:NnrS family protein [Acidobacteriota bacterium]
MKTTLPEAWVRAFVRERAGQVTPLADPAPERRIARLLGTFIGVGLFFLVLPGTLIGVWNLLRISASQSTGDASASWVQAHGHGQLFGWVATFIIGISLYTVPKFRGAAVRSLAVGWLMWALWTTGVLARWAAGLWQWHWQVLLPAAAAAEFLVAVLLLWEVTVSAKSRRRIELWNILVFAGLTRFALTMLAQLIVVVRAASPVLPPDANRWLLYAALWLFCFPVAWGFSTRFLPTFLGLPQPRRRVAIAGLVTLLVCPAVAAVLACHSLGIFEPPVKKPKTAGIDPRFPIFARLAFFWLILAALLQSAPDTPGLQGAGRHTFTVGFLATLIFTVGPRILPSFLNSRELWSRRLMLWSLVLLTIGCTLRATSEPLAYGNVLPLFWKLLPVSALVELTAVLLFAFNIARTLATPMPAWFEREQVKDTMTLYWYVTAYPATRNLLINAGLHTLARVQEIPKSLTLREAAEAEGVDTGILIQRLGDFFATRQARALTIAKSQ